MGGLVAQLGVLAAEIALPPVCLVCRRRLAAPRDRRFWTCAACRQRLTVAYPYLYCSVCGGRLTALRATCHSRRGFPVFAPLSYENAAVREIVHTFKYRFGRIAAPFLARIISESFSATVENCKLKIENSVLVPIPLYPSRERKRGFNQALALTRELKKSEILANLPVWENALIKTKGTPSQTKAESRERRLENIQGSFALRDPAALIGRNVVLVDDVFTTGATMREAARTLKKGGARCILGLAAARA